MEKITLKIKGMHCESCAKTIEKTLLKEKGIFSANVNFALEKAFIEYDPKEIGINEIKKVIKNAGYKVLAAEDEMKDEIKKRLAEILVWINFNFTRLDYCHFLLSSQI
jgi:Cu+-exporting ATPase